MQCPSCGHDNIEGVDACEVCGQPLTQCDYSVSELEQSIVRHSVSVLCPKTPVAVDARTSMHAVIGKLVEHGIGCLLIERDGHLVGIITERDILNNASSDAGQRERPVEELMTAEPTTVRMNESIAYALHLMDLGGCRHLPVVDDSEKTVGIISVRDILRFLCIRFGEIRSAKA